MISEKQFNQILGKVADKLSPEDYENLMDVISSFEYMLDETNQDDYFGTEGWKHAMGWDE